MRLWKEVSWMLLQAAVQMSWTDKARQGTGGSILEVLELLHKRGRDFKMGLRCGFWNGPLGEPEAGSKTIQEIQRKMTNENPGKTWMAAWQRWPAGETCMRTAEGELWGNVAQWSVRKLALLYFPHGLQLQMKQKYKVSCHSRETESPDEEVHLESKKELREKLMKLQQQRRMQHTANRVDPRQPGWQT